MPNLVAIRTLSRLPDAFSQAPMTFSEAPPPAGDHRE
jgi:hypothetical protein